MNGPLPLNGHAGPAALDVREVGKTFIRRRGFRTTMRTEALAAVSLDLRQGEILGIVGESGSGKTTLGRIIVGLEEPDSGTIVLKGRTLAGPGLKHGVAAAERGIGMIFQDPYSSLNPRMRVNDVVGEGLRIGGIGRRDIAERVAEALAIVGLRPEDRHRYPHEFSGGQRQRIGIARAIVMEPHVLIADEAVSSLDVSVQMQVLNVLLDIREKLRLGLIFITHNIGVVEYLCDRVIVLSQGKVVERGTTQEVIGAPQHEYTRKLLDAVPRF
jgi:ABC-type glutathione transport system ATPase component